MSVFLLYILSSSVAFLITLGSLPLFRKFCSPFLLDMPGGLKTHLKATPIVGGCGILFGLVSSLLLIRLLSDFPTGTLHSLRGIILGGALIFIMGILDDYKKPKGLSIPVKLCIQAIASALLIKYGIVIELFSNTWISYLCTFLWIVGLTNAFNLLDIMDGLCITQIMICTLGLLVISFHTHSVYINMAILALLGSCLAFWPYNHSQKYKTFLGDSGSNFLGFLVASLSIGTQYSTHHSISILMPIFILAIPLFDTGFVSLARILKAKNPLKGSNDHIALRLKKIGWSTPKILATFAGSAILCNLIAFTLVCSSKLTFIILLILSGLLASVITTLLLQIKMESK